jgi:hypothetical protein
MMAAGFAGCLVTLESRMRTFSPIRNWLIAVLCGLLCLSVHSVASTTTPSTKSTKTVSPSSSKSATHKKRSSTKAKSKSSKKRGQKAIESERAEQIQKALIREHYMEGQPSGKWDDATQAALRRYQADQGWQSKSVPDSRALIKLGLGPSHDHLLNPESAMTMAPSADQKSNKPGTIDPPKAPATSPVGQSGVPQQ